MSVAIQRTLGSLRFIAACQPAVPAPTKAIRARKAVAKRALQSPNKCIVSVFESSLAICSLTPRENLPAPGGYSAFSSFRESSPNM